MRGVETSALLRVELPLRGDAESTAAGLRDVSSWLALSWRALDGVRLTLRAFPFDTDYERLGYLHALDWGGTNVARGDSAFLRQAGGAPGVRLELDARKVRAFAGLKWATLSDSLGGARRLWGALSGASGELMRGVRIEGGFGYFQRASSALNPSLAPSFLEGASLRLVLHDGPAEPELSAEPLRPPSLRDAPTLLVAPTTRGLALALEGVVLVQRLRRFEQPGTSALVPAPAAALYGSARGHVLAAHLALLWRSLPFVLRNDASSANGETLPSTALASSELAAWLGGSASLPLGLVPSLEAGLRLPAALQTKSALPGFAQTLVVAGPAGLQALPVGAGRLPVVAVRVGSRFQASPQLALALFGEYQRNPNRVTFVARVGGATRTFAPPDTLAVDAVIQARF
jgi:hypothetical protein